MLPTSAGYQIFEGRLAVPTVQAATVTHAVKRTGVTVIVLPEGARGAVDVAGGAPATRETPVLDPLNTVAGPDAIVLTGGSAMGLATADGVALALAGAGRGVLVGQVRIPIVVAAAIFDLGVGRPESPTARDGRLAAQRALAGGAVIAEGPHCAGTGPTVGKALGMEFATTGGQAVVTLCCEDGLLVGVVAVVNAFGSVLGADGAVLAGPRAEGGSPMSAASLWTGGRDEARWGESTTLGAVVTNADLTKSQLGRVARMAHDGLARAIDPAHTPWDGDTIFAVSCGATRADVGRVGALAAHGVSLAIRRAVGLSNA